MAQTDGLVYASQLLALARGEETEDGNPLSAARYYITAMEIIAAEAAVRAEKMPSQDTRRFFLFQIRSKLAAYYERAELLLQVANESGLLDKAGASGGMNNMQYPPALFASTLPGDRKGSGTGGTGKSVLGIPLQQLSAEPPLAPTAAASSAATATATMTGNSNNNNPVQPPISYYISSDTSSPASPPPPVTSEMDLDELMRNLGAPPNS